MNENEHLRAIGDAARSVSIVSNVLRKRPHSHGARVAFQNAGVRYANTMTDYAAFLEAERVRNSKIQID